LWLAFGSFDRSSSFWHLKDVQEEPSKQFQYPKGSVHSLRFSDDSQKIYTSTSWTTTIHQVGTWELPKEINKDEANELISLSQNESILALSNRDGPTSLWGKELTQRTVLTAHQGGTSASGFLHRGTVLATAGLDAIVRLWDIETGEVRLLYGHHNKIYQLEISPNQKLIATTSLDGTVRLWEDDLPFELDALRAKLRRE
jgi:WD40 repeat protein